MTTTTRNPFTTIRTEGALLPVDLLQRIVAGDTVLGGLDPESYHLPGSEKLNEAINRSWNRLLGAWATFQTARGRLGEGDAGTTLTRERWLMPLFLELGYGRLQAAKSVTLEGKEYRVSHAWGEVPIHLVGCGVNLDRRQAGVTGAAKSSPHSLVQEYLNRNPNQLWGMLSNGLTLRVLRDNASLTRQAYLEFDLEAMLTGEVYADFVVLWLVCHQSRVETQEGKPETCRLETWSKAAQEQGTRALDKLRDGVEQAITALGGGFLTHPGNTALKARLRSGALTREGYYRQLLRLVYRLIFLFAGEDRDLLLDPQASPAARERYLKYYSATHLRQLAEQSRGGRHPDLYATLRLVSAMLGGREPGGTGLKGLGLPVLGSFLFSAEALPDLETAELENSALLSAVRGLAFILDGNTRRSVDYRNLGTRELGSVYESLLELHPLINIDAGTFELIIAVGNERKTTGSYYTAEDLIKVLLDSALDPVILHAILRAGPSVEAQIVALLALKVCDPACGSGHFLIAAARRVARRLAQLRSGDEEPSPEITRTALREVIQHCVYGVDINPMSVELCKVNLWLESIEPGKPLSFLESHIQCGDSLVGVTTGLDIFEIPDEAFNPSLGDDRPTSTALKKRNKRERGGQFGLFGQMRAESGDDDAFRWVIERSSQIEAMPENTPEQVLEKEKAFDELQQATTYHQKELEYNLWTVAFFWPINKDDPEIMIAPTQQALVTARSGESLKSELVEKVQALAKQINFFHWELRFPGVFTGDHPGFDCILGNPPWEEVETNGNETLSIITSHQQKFFKNSGRYPLTGNNRKNTYALFCELVLALPNSDGYTGLIVPTGIATDEPLAKLFQHLTANARIKSLHDFENHKIYFPSIHASYKYCLLTLGRRKDKHRTDYACFLSRVDDLRQESRHFEMSDEDFRLINPISMALPVIRSNVDLALLKKVHQRVPIFNTGSPENDWQLLATLMLNFSKATNDQKLHYTQLANEQQEGYIPIYEGESFHAFDHRFATFAADLRRYRDVTRSEHQDSGFIPAAETYFPISWLLEKYSCSWLIIMRRQARNTDERTGIATIIPLYAVEGSATVFIPQGVTAKEASLFVANLNSLVLDYILRSKCGGPNINKHTYDQLPILPLNTYTSADIDFIAPRVLELVYTASDLRSFAVDMNYTGGPFPWDEDRRAQLRAELDAYYAKFYGLTRDELRYILDPQEVYGSTFPSETFRVLKNNNMRVFQEYRTRRLVLEAWDRLEGVAPASTSTTVPTAVAPTPAPAPMPAKPVIEKKVPQPAQKAQPMLSDFGLYKCGICGKMVMGFEKGNHEHEKHGGNGVEWRKVR